jgi:hypothetical protein
MRCPLCETENPDGVAECAGCGKQFIAGSQLLADVPLVDRIQGLEATLQTAQDVAVERIPELEATQLARRDLRIQDERVPGIELTQQEEDPTAPTAWTPGHVELESGRELDLDPRTAAPADTGFCPWCGTPATGAVCDACGRRRSRYTQGAPGQAAASTGETVLCPACFARVAEAPRCGECGVPFAAHEL